MTRARTLASIGNISNILANIDQDLTTSSLVSNGLTYPQSDGNNGDALTTDGAGNLYFAPIAGGSGGIQVYSDISELPLTGVATGELAAVQSNNRLYFWNGVGWYNIALVNTSPNITQGALSAYLLSTDGTPTVITLAATDPEGLPITWSYAITSGSLTNGGGTTATITQNANVFTITPSTNEDYIGSFSITFSASDGVNISQTVSVVRYGLITPELSLVLNDESQIRYITNAQFGSTVAVSPNGNYAIVGAAKLSDHIGFESGKAYILNPTTGELLWTLDNPNAYSTGFQDSFGSSVAISDNYAIVGAWGEDDAGGGTNSGKAYIFNPSTGQLLWTLDNPTPYGNGFQDYFGLSVAISDNYAIVGAYAEDEAGTANSGKAYIFNPSTGQLLWTLNNPNAYSTGFNDQFGERVAISNNYAIVGAFWEDDAGGLTSGKAYIFNPSTGQLLWTLNNPNAYSTSLNDNFGSAVAISNNYAIVGAYWEDDTSGLTSGKAYVFNPATGALLWTLNNPNAYSTSTNDWFGYSVAISNNYAIVGAPNEDSTPTGSSSGKAYVFNPATGALLMTLDNPNAYSTSLNDNFGTSVAISDNYTIVGAYAEDSYSADFGIAYSFATTTGSLTATLNPPQPVTLLSTLDYFGYSVDASNNYAIVGAYGAGDTPGANSGKAYIFNPVTGALLWSLDNPNAYSTSASDQFGYSVAISDNYAIVGARLEDDAGGNSGSGKAYVFNPVTGALLWTLNNPNAYGTSGADEFGRSVAISDNYAIVGAPEEDDAGFSSSGKAYIFNPATGQLLWTLNNPNAYSTSLNDNFGSAVAISNNYAIVGAYWEDDTGGTFSGKAYVFNPVTGALLWTLDNPNAYGTSGSDYFGYSVAISDNYAIVGAHLEDDAGGADSGKAYVFNPATGQLLWTLDNPNAYGTSDGDQFGYSVDLFNMYAIVGAYNEGDAGGISSGKAYIFNVTTGQLLHTINNPNAYSTSAGDSFGSSVAIADSYAIVGAYNEDDASGGEAGKAYIFKL